MDRLLLITGAGRSGTSTMAGALHHLGLHVPGPFLSANESNPRGFFESRWSVRFHNRLLKRALVGIADARPYAADIARDAVRTKDRAALRDWLEQASAGHDLTVVKDPRAVWTLPLWSEAAADLRRECGVVVMVRHPAEVLGSRTTHYPAGVEALGAEGYATKNLAGWVNALLLTEQRTRGWARAFVRYDDLVTDWRSATARASRDLGIQLDLITGATEVDGFISPQLNRHRLTWDDVDVPADLREVADQVWSACEALAEGVRDASDFDAARARYASLYTSAERLSHDTTSAAVAAARRAAAKADGGQPPGGGAAYRGTTSPGGLRRRLLRRAKARLRR